MYIYPNNDARRPRSTVAPLRGAFNETENLEHIEPEATPELLQALRAKLSGAEEAASWYYSRNKVAFDAWHARWAGQTVDGRKWPVQGDSPNSIWPWPGASDTRPGTIDGVLADRLTVAMFALMNMKVQAQSSRPLASMKESQQATQLLNWMIFTVMSEEVYRELPLLMNTVGGFGAAALEVTWEQETRVYIQEVNLINLQALAQHQGAQASAMLDQFISDLFDPAGEENAIALVQSASPLVNTKAKARKILTDLRNLRYAQIPIPEVCKSQPRWSTLLLMQDLLFPSCADDLQRCWSSRVEFVNETTLVSRIESDDYDPDFVDQALEKRGQTLNSTQDWRRQYTGLPQHAALEEDDNDIRLEHFYRKGLHDGSTTAVYRTVFHQDVEIPAKHAPLEYHHGEIPFSVFRQELHTRPILSSRGLPEIIYTWEQEIKKQADMRSDRVDLALKPPLMTTYEDLVKMKEQFMPATILPMRRQDDARWFRAPPYDVGSIEITQDVMARIDRRFGYFDKSNPAKAQQISQQLADQILMEMKPVLRQTGGLIDQLIPDETVAMVLGVNSSWQRKSRQEIRGRWHYTATVDMRLLDPEFLKQMVAMAVQVLPADTEGVVDRADFIKYIFESMSYELAERVVRPMEPVTMKEKEHEMQAFDLIIGSGQDQPMPMGSNYQLRLQVMQQKMQSAQQNPATARILQSNPEILKVLQNRAQFMQRQIQQTENAQIGRMQVSNTFDKQAATPAAAGGGG
jgi:hypothetical protein